MNTPTVTMKVSPKELRMINAALSLFSEVASQLHQSNFLALNQEIVTNSVKRFATDTADGDARRLILRANALRESIDL